MGTYYRRILREIIDNIKGEIDSRYSEISHLEFFRLLDKDYFPFFKAQFPDELYCKLKVKWQSKFDFDRLKN